jgi:hypothetical protein
MVHHLDHDRPSKLILVRWDQQQNVSALRVNFFHGVHDTDDRASMFDFIDVFVVPKS